MGRTQGYYALEHYSPNCPFVGDIAGSHLQGHQWTRSGCQMGRGVASVAPTLPCLSYPSASQLHHRMKKHFRVFVLPEKKRVPSQIGFASSPWAASFPRKTHMWGTLSNVWSWRGDPGAFGLWSSFCGKAVACLWVHGLRRKDRMTRGRPGGSHVSTRPCKKQLMRSNGNL